MAEHNEVAVSDVDVKEPKRMSATLTSGEHDKLTILAMRKAYGATVHVETANTKTRKTSRGMTQKFESFERAVEVVKTLVAEAISQGWARKERSGGFVPRIDAFSKMPKAPSSPGKGKK